jgi:hypothetical protein
MRSYHCEHKPAKLKITSPIELDVYVDNKPMGKSNQEILIDMNDFSAKAKVMLFNPMNNVLKTQFEVKLDADKLTQRNIN